MSSWDEEAGPRQAQQQPVLRRVRTAQARQAMDRTGQQGKATARRVQ
jgi:hypothetical protein